MKYKRLTSEELKYIGVDFDDTIASNSGYPNYELSEPMNGAKEALEKIQALGYKIVIYTARDWASEYTVKHYMEDFKLPYDKIICGKLLCRWMIDDRNLAFRGDWQQMIDEIK